ncbi:MAG: MarR family transcriptional regulator [Desulfobacteraceae bacterium]|nr:MarR family transcriptional regulator [Desulfobacteraceae bacterium]
MEIQHAALITQIFGFIHKILFIEKKNKFQFDGVKLYPSEIHLILFIHQDQDTNATRMAERLGLTKGAISQTLSRLEKKGILRKTKDPFNKNELTIEFTPLGKSALEHYLNLSAELHRQYDQYLSTLTETERTTIRGFLSHAELIMDRIAEKVR